mgnify:CR=1 FL=1
MTIAIEIEITPNLAAAQFLPLRRLDRLVSRIIKRNRPLHAAIVAARHEARLEHQKYDAWLCAQAHTQFDDDLP